MEFVLLSAVVRRLLPLPRMVRTVKRLVMMFLFKNLHILTDNFSGFYSR